MMATSKGVSLGGRSGEVAIVTEKSLNRKNTTPGLRFMGFGSDAANDSIAQTKKKLGNYFRLMIVLKKRTKGV